MKYNNGDQSVAMSSTRGHICGEEYNKYRRERIATAVLAGLCANSEYNGVVPEYLMPLTMDMTDTLIKELDK